MNMYWVIAYIFCCLATYAGHKYIDTRFNINHFDDMFVYVSSLFWPIGFFYITGECFSMLALKHREEVQKLLAARAKAEESRHRLQLCSTEDLLEELSLRDDLRSDTVKRLRP